MADLTDLIGNADAFPVLRRWTYVNHAGIGPLPTVAADQLRTFADEAAAGAYLDTDWWPHLDRVRRSAATLVNAEAAEVALVKNTSEGISTVAFGLPLAAGDRVVTAAVEYSANVFPWMAACRAAGAELVMVPEVDVGGGRRAVPLDQLLAAVEHPRTRVLTISHVQFGSGQRNDLAALGSACRDRGVFFNVDGIQSLGCVPVDVVGMRIDALSACGHKWMLGPPGAGLLYVRREWQDRIRPALIGHTTMANWEAFDTRYVEQLRPDAGRYESGTINLPGTFAWGASLDLLNTAGMDAVAGRIKHLTDRLADGFERKGWTVVSPRDGGAWSGIVAVTSPQHDPAAVAKSLLKDHRIETCVREGRLRVAPHFYNTDEQVEQVVAAVPAS